MGNNSLFFSLQWKLAILFGCVFLLLQSLFTYISYLDAQENFEADRNTIQTNQIKIAETLTKDSFAVLEQFAELVSEFNNPLQTLANGQHQTTSVVDENWSKWQLIWDIENIVFFDNHGKSLKSWGEPLINQDFAVQNVLEHETPQHQIFCKKSCYQEAIVPVLLKSDIGGAFSVIRSFSDILIKYRDATNSDIGILVAEQNETANSTKT